MTAYSFNGITVAGVTLDIASPALLIYGDTTFRALVFLTDAPQLPREVPAGVVCSNLRLIEGDRGASHRIRARGEAEEIVEQEDGLIVLKGSMKSFMLE